MLRGEIVTLLLPGDEHGIPTPTSWDVRVLVADVEAPDTASEVLHTTVAVQPVSIAWWKGFLFLGTGDGQVLRATPAP